MMRKCHLNTCPVGVATQDPELRAKFTGKPEYVINYLFHVAEEVREYMASFGFKTFNEMIGQTDRITIKRPLDHWKARGLDLSKILFKQKPIYKTDTYRTQDQNHAIEKQLDNELIKLSQPAIQNGERVEIKLSVKNINRTVGTMLSGEVAKKYGNAGLPDGTINILLEGTAGQSFGTFLAKGIELKLIGESNDYTGKGLSGGRLIVKVPEKVSYDPAENIIIGNTCLYGATGGEAYFNGVAGERFAVRNSGAHAVIEGVGDHGCEYMTGGRVAVLGKTGRNFAAGMSGGIAYVWDSDKQFKKYLNSQLVDVEALSEEDFTELYGMINNHLNYTNSKRAEYLLNNWKNEKLNFLKIIPFEYKAALQKLIEEEKKNSIVEEETNFAEVANG